MLIFKTDAQLSSMSEILDCVLGLLIDNSFIFFLRTFTKENCIVSYIMNFLSNYNNELPCTINLIFSTKYVLK